MWIPWYLAYCVKCIFADSQDVCRRNLDLGIQYGNVRRTKEILNWARKRRRNIRREDLIAFLCGRPPPVRHRPASVSRSTSRVVMERSSPRLHAPSSSQSRAERDEPDLQPFRDALALQGLLLLNFYEMSTVHCPHLLTGASGMFPFPFKNAHVTLQWHVSIPFQECSWHTPVPGL